MGRKKSPAEHSHSIRFDYGRTGLEVRPPKGPVREILPGEAPSHSTTPPRQVCVRAHHPPALVDPYEATRSACRQPLGSPPLAELAHGHQQALITVSDRTRPVPNRLLLGTLLEELDAGGIPPERVTVLVATGLHYPPGDGELLELVGEEVLSQCRVRCHDARDDSAQCSVGEVAGESIRMDRTYVEAEFRIVTGLIEPHLMAGYSGGRKGVCPGVLAARSILHWHRPQLLAHPKARAGVLARNPVHREAEEIADLAPPHFLLNVTIDRERRVTGVFAGDWREAWSAGVSQAARSMVVSIDRPADVVVTSAGGYPLDATFYQAVKGAVTAAGVVRPGGVVILAASLSEGVGSPEFQALFRRYPDAQTFLDRTMHSPEVHIDQWQGQMLAQAKRRAEVWVYSDGLSGDELGSLYVEPLASVEEGIDRARTMLGEESSILYLPEGPYVVPVLSDALREGSPTGLS